jgi:outer membrane biosynthesis protein TonB
MKTGLTISIVGHACVLLWGLVSFSSKPLNAPPVESMPIDIISTKEFSELRAGARNAPKAETPKPLVEKAGDKKPVDNPLAKIVEKPELITASSDTPPPPQAEPPDPKAGGPQPAEAKPEPKPPEEKPAQAKSDPIAEAIKKDETKKEEPKKDETKTTEVKKPEPKKAEVKPAAAKKPDAKPQPKFDANKIAALLDKRQPQRVAAVGETLNRTLALGTRTGEAVSLSQSELDALRARLHQCWNAPAGAADADKRRVLLVLRFNQDGTLSSPPQPETAASDPFTQAMIDSAVRATLRCQPYTMLSPAKYELWREIEVDFSLDDMFGN